MIIQRTRKSQITKQHSLYKNIDVICFLAKNLYNTGLYHFRQSYFKNVILSYTILDKLLQNSEDYKALPAKVAHRY